MPKRQRKFLKATGSGVAPSLAGKDPRARRGAAARVTEVRDPEPRPSRETLALAFGAGVLPDDVVTEDQLEEELSNYVEGGPNDSVKRVVQNGTLVLPDASSTPVQVTPAERDAGTETDLRSFSPFDVADMAETHGDTAEWGKITGNLPDQTDLDLALDAKARRESGFVDRTQSTMSFDDVTRTFTIQPTGASYDVFVDGVRFTKTAPEGVIITNIDGMHFLYFDSTGKLLDTTAPGDFLFLDAALVATIRWDATNSQAIQFGETRHATEMDAVTRLYNHRTVHARYGTGLGLTNFDIDGDGNVASSAQFACENGVIWNEDIKFSVNDGAPQELSPIAEIPVFYRSGLLGEWRRLTATQYAVPTAGSGRAAWNQFTGGAWQLSEIGNGNFVFTHLVATGDLEHPVIAIAGQAEYSNLNNARDNAEDELLALDDSDLGLLNPETVWLATIIWETRSNYTNAVKSRIRSTGDGDDYIDWRGRSGGSASGSAAATVWGSIIGTLSDQVDLDAALDAASIATADQTIVANRLIDDGNNGYRFTIDLRTATGQICQLVVNPVVPSFTMTGNDGAGNIVAFQVGSANFNESYFGNADRRINSSPGVAGQVYESGGPNAPPRWGNKHKRRFYDCDFESNDTRTAGPYIWVATNSGTNNTAPSTASNTQDVFGVVTMRSSASANSGGAWRYSQPQRLRGRAGLFFRCHVYIPSTFAQKTIKLGYWDDTTNSTAATDGTYFTIDTSGSATGRTANNGVRSATSSFSMSAETWYIFEVDWESTSLVRFRILSIDEATEHLNATLTTNIPTGTARLFGGGILALFAGTTATDICYVDYIGAGLNPYRDGL